MNNSIGVIESKEEERRALTECNNHQDLFNVYIRSIISHAPPVYVFINITLVIWIAQTVFSQKINQIPKSLYLISPFLTMSPISTISIMNSSGSCPKQTSDLSLKSFPTIYSDHITHKLLYNWGQENVKFCVTRLTSKKSDNCPNNYTLCSGYCVNSIAECPITNIKIAKNISQLNQKKQIYSVDGKHYQISRTEGTPIVSLFVSYAPQCANDERFNDVFDNQPQFWSQIKSCGKQGTISSFFNEFDSMETNSFFSINQIGITITDQSLQSVEIGSIPQFQVLSTKQGCDNIEQYAVKIQKFLQSSPVSPQFTQPLLIIAFILLVGQLLWLAGYYCFEGLQTEKNIIAIIFSIMELVIIAFIYNQNIQLFSFQKWVTTLNSCLANSLPALQQWHYGIESPQVFQMVIFANTVFLGLYLSALLLNYFGFEDYKNMKVYLPRIQHNT